MSEFTRVASVGDIPDPGQQTFEVDERLVVVFHVDGQFYCLDDICTHDGGPLGDGALHEHEVACPRHGARFDIRDGRAVTMPATAPTASHQVKVEDGGVFVRINDGSEQTEAVLSEELIREELKKVIDPELFVNIVDLGLIYNVEIRPTETDGQADVLIEMTLTSPMCPAGPQLVANSKQVVAELEGVSDTEVRLVMQPVWSPDCMTDDARDQLGIF